MARKSLAMDIRVGESIAIDGGRVVITLDAKSGRRARVTFTHESDVDVRRKPASLAAPAVDGSVSQRR